VDVQERSTAAFLGRPLNPNARESRGGEPHVDGMYDAWLDPDADIPNWLAYDPINNLPPCSPEGTPPTRKVRINMLALDWGGESIPNPFPDVFGVVKELILDGRDGRVCFDVDLGVYLGNQLIPVEDCRPWEAPLPSLGGTIANDCRVECHRLCCLQCTPRTVFFE
jgi:hypothetical protein